MNPIAMISTFALMASSIAFAGGPKEIQCWGKNGPAQMNFSATKAAVQGIGAESIYDLKMTSYVGRVETVNFHATNYLCQFPRTDRPELMRCNPTKESTLIVAGEHETDENGTLPKITTSTNVSDRFERHVRLVTDSAFAMHFSLPSSSSSLSISDDVVCTGDEY